MGGTRSHFPNFFKRIFFNENMHRHKLGIFKVTCPKAPLNAAFKTPLSCGYGGCTHHLFHLDFLILFSSQQFSIFLMPSGLPMLSIYFLAFYVFIFSGYY